MKSPDIRQVVITMPVLVAERILEAWGVPKDAWKGLIEGSGAVQVQEIQEALETLMPVRTANEWMGRPSKNPLFDGQPPMRKLLEAGGLAAIRRFVRGRLNIWGPRLRTAAIGRSLVLMHKRESKWRGQSRAEGFVPRPNAYSK